MSCRSFTKRIALWVGGDLGSADAAAVRGHLEACAACCARAEGLRRSLAVLRALDARAGEDLGRIRVRPPVPVATPSRRPWAALATASAAAVTAAAVLLAVLGRNRTPPTSPAVRVVRLTAPTAPGPELAHDQGKTGLAPAPPQLPTVPAAGRRLASGAIEHDPERAARAPFTIKILTEDPDVVIYWVVDPKGASDEPQDT